MPVTSVAQKEFKPFIVSAGTGLTINVGAGIAEIGGSQINYAGVSGTAVTASSTNYVQVNSSGTLVINTTSFVAGNLPLATVTTNGSVVTAISDLRPFLTSRGSTGSASWVRGVPTGSINGSNVTFTLPSTPDSNSLLLILDGQTMEPGGNDYSLSGTTITFTTAPATSSKLIYFYTLSTPISGDRFTLAWSEVTGTSQALAVGSAYILNNAGLVTATLPATASLGDEIEIVGKGAGGWKIAQNSGQTIYFGNQTTTAGTGGYLASTHRRDVVKLVCITQDTEWEVRASQGSITVN